MLQAETYIYGRLTPRQIEALPFLIRPGTITQRAKNAGISRTTLHRWLQEDDFREVFDEVRKETRRVSLAIPLWLPSAFSWAKTTLVCDNISNRTLTAAEML